MKKKRKTSKRAAVLRRVAGLAAGNSVGELSSLLAARAEKTFDRLHDKIIELEDQMLKHAFSSLLVGSGVVLFVLAGLFYLIDVVGVSRTSSMLYLAISFLLIGFYLKYQFLKRREEE